MICDKIAYPTYKEASKAATNLKRHRKDRHQYSVYRCPQCGSFHVTTVTKKRLAMPKKMNKYPLCYNRL